MQDIKFLATTTRLLFDENKCFAETRDLFIQHCIKGNWQAFYSMHQWFNKKDEAFQTVSHLKKINAQRRQEDEKAIDFVARSLKSAQKQI